MSFFSSPSPLRQRIMATIEEKLTAVENAYDHMKARMIERHAEEIASLHARHDNEHEGLLEDTVSKFLSNIL